MGRSVAHFSSLKAWRTARNLNQRQAAELFGITQGAYAKIELGRNVPRTTLLRKIHHATGVPLEVLTRIAA